jgi:hypothetical protein
VTTEQETQPGAPVVPPNGESAVAAPARPESPASALLPAPDPPANETPGDGAPIFDLREDSDPKAETVKNEEPRSENVASPGAVAKEDGPDQVVEMMGPAKALRVGTLVLISPKRLTPHPDLARFPEHSQEDSARLDQGISERFALTDPIKIDTKYQILDGRGRWKSAMRWDLAKVPAIVMADSEDPINLAITTSVDCRHLTKSAIALVLFEQHPTLRADRDVRKKRGLKRQYPVGNNLRAKDERNLLRQGYGKIDSYRTLARRYQVDKDYFTYLNEMWDFSSEGEWEEIRTSILAGEAEIKRLISGFAGRKATKSKKRKDPNRYTLARKAITKVLPVRIGKHWKEFSVKQRDMLTQDTIEAFKKLPKEFVKQVSKELAQFVNNEGEE